MRKPFRARTLSEQRGHVNADSGRLPSTVARDRLTGETRNPLEPCMARKEAEVSRIEVKETQPGKVAVYINTTRYGSTGKHWADVLGSPRAASKYGKLTIDRPGAKRRRKDALAGWETEGPGDPTDLDECPGAMFLCSTQAVAHVEACDAGTNRSLGSDLKTALTNYPDWTEVVFHFKQSQFSALPGKVTVQLK